MASTSGLSTFNLDFNEIVEEAYERAGLEVRTGYEFRTARRSFNMLTIEWANRGINLWTIEQGQFVMNTGQGVYALPSDTIDLLDQVIRTQAATPNQIDINISRISESTYSTLPNKLAQGRPIQVWVNRQSNQSYIANAAVAATVLSTDTTITLDTTNGLPATGFITIDSETIYFACHGMRLRIDRSTANLFTHHLFAKCGHISLHAGSLRGPCYGLPRA